MKEIKFRSAHYNSDGSFNGFSYWGFINRFEATDKDSFCSPTSRNGTYRSFEDQFIGLKDKNGLDIYEGDLYLMNERVFIVVFDNAAFCVSNIKKNCPQPMNWEPEDEYDSKPYDFSNRIEIIGNIHQNPELLK